MNYFLLALIPAGAIGFCIYWFLIRKKEEATSQER